MDTKKTGNLGEKIAEKYLREKGYRILDRNYVFQVPGSPQKAEIDIIAKKGNTVFFVEVKTLRQERLSKVFSPEDKVDFWKRKKIAKAAEHWLTKKKIPLDSKWEITIIAVTIDTFNNKARVRRFENVK